MARRYTDAAERAARDREIRRLAANRRVGHEHAYWILFGAPAVKALLPLAVAAVVCALLWFNVSHKLLAMVAAVAGIAMLMLFAASTIGATGTQARQMARATGQRARPLWWYGVATAGALLCAFAYQVTPR